MITIIIITITVQYNHKYIIVRLFGHSYISELSSKEDRSSQTNSPHYTSTLIVHTMHHTSIRIHHTTHHTHHTRRTYHTYLYLAVGGCSDDEGSRVTHTHSSEEDCKDRSRDGDDDGGVIDLSREYGPESGDILVEGDRGENGGEMSKCGSGDGNRKGNDSGREETNDCVWGDRMSECDELGNIEVSEDNRQVCVNEASIKINERERKNDVWKGFTEERADEGKKHSTKQEETLKYEEGEKNERREAEERQTDHTNEEEEEWEEATNESKTQEQGQKENEEEEEGEETAGDKERQREATRRIRTLAKVGCVVA